MKRIAYKILCRVPLTEKDGPELSEFAAKHMVGWINVTPNEINEIRGGPLLTMIQERAINCLVENA